MISDKLWAELRHLDQTEKLLVIQKLVNELASRPETLFQTETNYEVYTPYGNEPAAEILYKALKDAQQKDPN